MPDDSPKRAPSVEIHAVVDRIEDGDLAVLLAGDDEKTKIDFPASLLPEGAGDGDHLRITIRLDEKSRAAAEDRVKGLLERLEKRGGTKGKKDFKL
ncbi:MAG: DUF3006 domain-containing protein [Acidobacteria bacterium]|nr:DUF3006 domain-containing protein [Acidobacteriota bacterium]